MASILEIVFQGDISPETVVAWLQKSIDVHIFSFVSLFNLCEARKCGLETVLD